MSKILTIGICIIFAVLISAVWLVAGGPRSATVGSPGGDLPANGPGVGVAVVELFTSQGCSSCPPAEKLLGDLNLAAVKDKSLVFTLAFHVDYWNQLGWQDPFSTAAYSKRQSDYGAKLHLDQIYTPQMIVNGQTEFVGSDREKADAAVAKALATNATVPVSLKLKSQNAEKGDYQIEFATTGSGSGQVVNFAVVEQGLSTEVKRGENAGRLLDQPSVVRYFKSVPAVANGSIDIQLPSAVKADKSTVVAYVQRSDNGAILGAAALWLK
jgi:hypothetical protein